MKKLMVVGMLAISVSVQADSVKDLCGSLAGVAKITLGNRYSGVTVVDMKRVAGDNTTVESIIDMAFEEPQYHARKNIDKHISDFTSKVYIQCEKTLEGDGE